MSQLAPTGGTLTPAEADETRDEFCFEKGVAPVRRIRYGSLARRLGCGYATHDPKSG